MWGGGGGRRRRGVTGARAAIKGPGAAGPCISLARSHSGRSSTSVAAGQHPMGMGTALAARLGLGLLLLALLLPTQVSPGVLGAFPPPASGRDAGAAAPRPSRRGGGAGFSREEFPLVAPSRSPSRRPAGGRGWRAAPPPGAVAGETNEPGQPRLRTGRGWARTGGGASPSPGTAVPVPWIILVKI